MEHKDEVRETALRILKIALHGIEQANANIGEAKNILSREQERIDNLQKVVADLDILLD